MQISKCPNCFANPKTYEVNCETVLKCSTCRQLFYLSGSDKNESQFHKYILLEKIGEGANALVHRAINSDNNSCVALKMFRHFSEKNSSQEDQYRKEVKLESRLSHERIISVIDSGHKGNIHYVEMEYFASINLYDYIKKYGAMPEEDTLHVGHAVTEALNYLWSNHLIVHRDIKPHNILLGHNGEVKLCDFGLTNDHGEWFDADNIEGSPYYLNPESIEGDYQDNRSDIYSLGASLYHIISNKPPFKCNNLRDTIYSRLNQAPPDVRDTLPEISENTSLLLQVMMAQDPDDRYITARDCQIDIEKILSGQPPYFTKKNLIRSNSD